MEVAVCTLSRYRISTPQHGIDVCTFLILFHNHLLSSSSKKLNCDIKASYKKNCFGLLRHVVMTLVWKPTKMIKYFSHTF
jgi:hypothetical protein